MTTSAENLSVLLRTLKLPSFKGNYEEIAQHAEREGWSFSRYLMHLAETEIEDRRMRRIERELMRGVDDHHRMELSAHRPRLDIADAGQEKPRLQLPIGQRCQCVRVNQNEPRLMKCTNQVLG